MRQRDSSPQCGRSGIGAIASAVIGCSMVAAVGGYAAFLTPRAEDAALPVGMPAADLGAAICLIGVMGCTVWLWRGLVRGRRRLWV